MSICQQLSEGCVVTSARHSPESLGPEWLSPTPRCPAASLPPPAPRMILCPHSPPRITRPHHAQVFASLCYSFGSKGKETHPNPVQAKLASLGSWNPRMG